MGALSELVSKARRGVVDSKLELVEHLRPMVHGLLLAWVPHRLAGPQVRDLLSEGFAASPPPTDEKFVPALMQRARAHGQQLARAQPPVAEGADADAALALLARLRRLPEREREICALRLVEGVAGPQIAEGLGVSEREVSAALESGLASLLDGAGSVPKHDPYLWNLSGTPPAAVLRFENLLTALRFDDSAHPADPETSPVGVNAVELTPVSDAGPVPAIAPPAGRRATHEHRPQGATEPRRSNPAQRPMPATVPAAPAVVPARRPEPTDPSGEQVPLLSTSEYDDATEAIGVDPRRPNPFAQQPATVAAPDLPAAAQANPYAAMPSTVAANDLPAAARVSPAATANAPVSKRPTGTQVPQMGSVQTVPVQTVGDAGETRIAPPPRPTRGADAGDAPETVRPEAGGAAARTPISQEERPTRLQAVLPPTGWKSSLFAEDDEEGSITLPARERDRLLRKKGVWRGRAPFLLAVMMASLGFALAWTTVTSSGRRATRAWNLVPVTVAAFDLSEGSVVTTEMIATRAVPEQFVTASVVKPDSYSYVIGQKTLVPVQAGDPLLWSHFELSQTTERLSRRVSKRARAITINAGGADSVGGWVRPGDTVDLIVSLKDGPKGTSRAAVTLVQAVPVVATGKISAQTNYGLLTPAQRNYMNVSLLLLPEEVEMVTLANAVGNFKLTLRNQGDHDVNRDGYGTSARTLLDGARVKLLQMRRLATIQNIRSARVNDGPHSDKLRIEPRPQ